MSLSFPSLFFCRLTPAPSESVFYFRSLKSSHFKSGRLAAQLLGKMLPDGGNLQLLVAKKSISNYAATNAKFKGFLEYIHPAFPNISLLPILNELDGRESIDTALTKVLSTKKVDGILDLSRL